MRISQSGNIYTITIKGAPSRLTSGQRTVMEIIKDRAKRRTQKITPKSMKLAYIQSFNQRAVPLIRNPKDRKRKKKLYEHQPARLGDWRVEKYAHLWFRKQIQSLVWKGHVALNRVPKKNS